jgi:hypothetical protein
MNTPFGMPSFDPSKMDPKMMMQLAELIRQLPPDKISKMQALTHNMMAGFDVRKEMEEFENTLPPGFREKLVALMGSGGSAPPTPDIDVTPSPSEAIAETTPPQNLREARVTLLRAVADGRLQPEEAEKLLFPE